MSDEEKKAISILKQRDRDFDELYTTYRQSFIKPYDKSIRIVLNLIEKQQKEIEELKEKNKKVIDFINNENNYFEDGENWQNILKIKAILEE